MKYKFVLFDLDGTLFNYEKAEKTAFKMTFDHFGLDETTIADLNEKYKIINEKIWRDFQTGNITAERLRTERFTILCEQENLFFDPEKISKKYLENLSQCSFLIDGAIETVSFFHQNCKIALVTNGLSDVQHARLEKSPLKNYFRDIFISEEIGVAKPNRHIFEYVFSELGLLKKNDVMIVGDNLFSDILGGNNFGIDTCWFNPNRLINETDIIPSYEVFKLSELRKIVS